MEPAFREQDFGVWTGRRHNDLVAELGDAYQDFWKSAATNRPPGGESFVDQIARADAGLAPLPGAMSCSSCIPARSAPRSPSRLILIPTGALRFVIDPLSVTRIDRLQSGWRVVAVNQR